MPRSLAARLSPFMCAAIALANLCVAYIMTNANDEAEEIMRRIEEEEAR